MKFGDLNKLMKAFTDQENNKPIEDFEGLSANQMQNLLDNPFTEPSPVIYKEKIRQEILDQISFLLLTEAYLKYIEENKEVKLTAIGNLPRNLVLYLYGLGYVKEDALERGITKLSKEDDSITIQNTKIMCDISGLTTKKKGKISLSKKGKDLLSNRENLFKEIFSAYSYRFNWAYHDAYGEEQIGKLGAGFTIALLLKYGTTEREARFYSDKYLKAFPMLIDNLPEANYSSREERFANCFTVRTFERFLDFFGLIKIRQEGNKWRSELLIRKTEILDEIFDFPDSLKNNQ